MIYITQGRFSQPAMKGMVANPEDRTEQVKGLMERIGGRLLGYYITLGEYDFLIVAEGDVDLHTYVAMLAMVGAGGGVTDLKSTVAMPASDMKAMLEKARAGAGQFRSAGQG